MADVNNPKTKEIKKVYAEASEAAKAALLISRADKQRYRRLKDDLDNNYLPGSNRYPDTSKKALRILGNYQAPKSNLTFRGNQVGMVVFIQRGRETG